MFFLWIDWPFSLTFISALLQLEHTWQKYWNSKSHFSVYRYYNRWRKRKNSNVCVGSHSSRFVHSSPSFSLSFKGVFLPFSPALWSCWRSFPDLHQPQLFCQSSVHPEARTRVPAPAWSSGIASRVPDLRGRKPWELSVVTRSYRVHVRANRGAADEHAFASSLHTICTRDHTTQ